MALTPVEEIKQKLDLLDVVGEYVKLTKSGRNHKGLCPFHSEKSPSFMVNQDKQIFHCFGCNKGGDVFTFIGEIEGLDFPETLRLLAQKAGVTLRRQNPAWQNQKTKWMDLLRLAADFYHLSLVKSHEGERARKYLDGRFLTSEVIEQWNMGYSSEQWDTLLQFMKRKGFAEKDLETLGLVVRRESGTGYYDRFRGRIMFPIQDMHGQVIGFGGRIVQALENTAKYINSPQTPVYNKSEVLYGIYQAKEHIRKAGVVIVVEGYMDVIGCHLAGFKNVVASSGTALTEEQVRQLKRYAPTVILSFDQDAAGEAAAWRGIEVALAQGMNVRVLTVPFGKDPDEACHADPQAFAQAIKEAEPVMDYYFSSAVKCNSPATVEGKKALAQTLLPFISRLPDTVEQIHYTQKLADLIHVPEEVLRARLVPVKKTASTPVSQAAARLQTPVQVTTPADRFTLVSERILALLLTHPRLLPQAKLDLLPEFMVTPEQQTLYTAIISWYDRGQLGDLSSELESDAQIAAQLPRLLLLSADQFETLDSEQAATEFAQLIKEFRLQAVMKRLRTIQQELISAERQQDSKRVKQLTDESQQLTQQLFNLE
ncbi:MAG: DNA primase [Patescibacteria group bacterium]